MQQFNNYPYYGQPVYPQHHHPGPSSGYPSFYPPPFLPQGPAPVAFDAAAYTQPQHGTATPRAQAHRRIKTIAAVPSTPAPPRKSALKKNNTLPTSAQAPDPIQISRQRTNSISQQQHNTLHRVRTYSNAKQSGTEHTSPEEANSAHHLFMSFHGYSELRLDNVSEPALKELEDVIWPMWPEGRDSQVVNHTAIVKFRNDPWDLSGPQVEVVYEIIVKLFSLCASRGYAFQTSIDLASPTPRLVFQPTGVDDVSHFFLAYLSQGGRRLNLIRPPELIDYGLSAKLRAALPRTVPLEVGSASGYLRIIEVKRKSGSLRSGKDIEPGLFLMHILRIISEFGYHLDATIPLGRRGPFGIRYRRELLVFKGSNSG